MRFLSKALLAITALGVCAATSQAAILNYNISYTGAGTFVSENATGSGTLQITTSGLTGTITGFAFTDTITGSGGSSGFSYTLANLLNTSSVTLGGTAANPTLATLALNTGYVSGTNPAFGPVNFNGNYSGANPGSGNTNGNTAGVLSPFTTGPFTVTLGTAPTSTPEPATFSLLGGALIAGFVARKRFSRTVL